MLMIRRFKEMLHNLIAELRRVGLHQYDAAKALGIAEARFSTLMNGRAEFTPIQKARLSELVGLPQEQLFSEARGGKPSGTPLPQLLKELDAFLAGDGDICFLLSRILRQEPRDTYDCVCAHLFGVLRHARQIRPDVHRHFTGRWEQFGSVVRYIISDDPPMREGEDSIRTAGEMTIHPVPRRGDFPGPRENMMANPGGERR
jgi:predicted XRE-type DNA-binding protein